MSGMEQRYAEDLRVGQTIDLGSYTASADEIIQFAQRWDPQGFHTDPVVAAEGIFGEVIGSGIHSLAIFQRLAVLGAYRHWAMIAGRRVGGIELSSPLRPGMQVTGSVTIEDVQNTRGDRALCVLRGRLTHQQNVVLEAVFESYVRRRPPH
jgi:acyl dehydratase